MAGGMCGRGACVVGGVRAMHTSPDTMRYGRSMHGRYASYWNAFLLVMIFESMLMKTKSPGSRSMLLGLKYRYYQKSKTGTSAVTTQNGLVSSKICGKIRQCFLRRGIRFWTAITCSRVCPPWTPSFRLS